MNKEYSYMYLNQPLYRLMLWNVKDQLANQDLHTPSREDFNIFDVTATIAMAVDLSKETVMSDYVLFCKG